MERIQDEELEIDGQLDSHTSNGQQIKADPESEHITKIKFNLILIENSPWEYSL